MRSDFGRECKVAEKENREMHDRYGNPLTGPKAQKDTNATGRTLGGTLPWANWSDDELRIRAHSKATEEMIKAPRMAKIKAKYPTLKPDPA